MNITFLIGNGFDLNIGLKTTYKHFCKEYRKPPYKNEVDEFFKTNMLKNQKLWSDAEIAFGLSTKAFKENNFTADSFCECHEDFCVNLAKYLKEQEQLINYTEQGLKITDGFLRGLLAFKNGFREAERDVIASAETSFSGGYIFNFLDFNYTAVLDICVSKGKENEKKLGIRKYTSSSNSIGKVVHVHGTVEEDMVLGVNDTTQIADMSLFEGYDEEYVYELIKPKTNEINERNTDKKAFDLLKSSNLIYIYGMSTGETDKLWWQRICNLMKENSKLHLIIHAFDAPKDKLIRRENRLYDKKIKNTFVDYSDFDNEIKKDLMSRIHIDSSNVFSGLNKLVENDNKIIFEKDTVVFGTNKDLVTK